MVEPHSPSPRAELRLLAAFAVVPPAVGVLTFVTCLALWSSGHGTLSGGRPTDPVDAAVSVAMGVGILAVLVTVFGAVPAVVWLIGRGPLSLRKLLLLGAALGNAPLAIIIVAVVVARLVSGTLSGDVGRLWYGLPGAFLRTAIGLVCGMAAAAVFWAVGVRGTELERAPTFRSARRGAGLKSL